MEELNVPLDPDGFSRRECPHCRAAFKMRWGPREERVVAAAIAARVHELRDAEPSLERTCPYCAFRAPAEQFFTPDVQQQLDREARAFDKAVRAHRLSLPAEWLAKNPRASALATKGKARRAPVHPDGMGDLVRLALLCCGEEQKVTDAWLGPIRCHLCGIAHLRAGPRDFGLELALLRQWAQPKP